MNKTQHLRTSKKTKKQYLSEYAQFPALSKAVLRQMGATWAEIVAHPSNYANAENGVSGFIYYRETEPFASRHLGKIMQCYNWFTEECMGHPWGKPSDLNWLAWFALEHTVGEITNYMED